MKKTLIITMEFPPTIGGIASYVEQFALQMPSDTIMVLAQKNKKRNNKEYPFLLLEKKFLYPKFMWPRWLRLYFHVRKIVKEYGIEQIHLHHILPVGYVAYMIKKYLKIPYIVFSHGTDVIALQSKKRKVQFATKVIDQSKKVIVNSTSLAVRLASVFSAYQDKIEILYPCPSEIYKQKAPQSEIEILKARYGLEGKKVMLSVGRLVDGKGFPVLMRYMKKLIEKIPNLVWIIVGDGPKKEILFKQMQDLQLQSVIRFVGEMVPQELNTYYELADIFVLLTHPDEGREEGLGLVFLEASLKGLPIVAGRSGGVEEAVLHAQTGLVVESFNEEQCVDAITTLLTNTNFAEEISQSAKERMLSEFHFDHQIEKIQKYL